MWWSHNTSVHVGNSILLVARERMPSEVLVSLENRPVSETAGAWHIRCCAYHESEADCRRTPGFRFEIVHVVHTLMNPVEKLVENSKKRQSWEKPVVERLGGLAELTQKEFGNFDSAAHAHGENQCPPGQFPCSV